jgi:hypothetical protein
MTIITSACRALLSGRDRPIAVGRVARLLLSSGRQVCCGWRGHEMLLHFEPGRLSLQCVSCGAETPGWRIDSSPQHRVHPRRAAATEARPPHLQLHPSKA